MAGGLDFLINIQAKMGGNAIGELGELQKKIQGESAALAQLEAAMKRMQKSGSIDIEQYKKLQGAIDSKKQSLAGLGERLADLSGKADKGGTGIEALDSKIAGMGGPMGIATAAI